MDLRAPLLAGDKQAGGFAPSGFVCEFELPRGGRCGQLSNVQWQAASGLRLGPCHSRDAAAMLSEQLSTDPPFRPRTAADLIPDRVIFSKDKLIDLARSASGLKPNP